MANELSICRGCGKIFGTTPGRDLCAVCGRTSDSDVEAVARALLDEDCSTINDVMRATGFSRARIERVLRRSPSTRHALDKNKSCSKCSKRAAQAGSDFCFRCRLELYNSFGDAADMLFAHLEPLEPPSFPKGNITGFRDSLAEKRGRARAGRIMATRMPRVK